MFTAVFIRENEKLSFYWKQLNKLLYIYTIGEESTTFSFFTKGQIVNILDFAGYRSLLQLLSTAIVG